MAEKKPVAFDPKELIILPSDKQPTVLLNWLSDVADDLADRRTITAEYQQYISGELKKVFEYVETCLEQVGCQLNSWAFRHSIGRIYQMLYSSDQSKDLYETANRLLNTVNSSGKQEKSAACKHFAVVSLGYIYSAAGSKIISIVPLAVMSILKNLKSSSSNAGLRYSYLAALEKICSCDAIDSQAAREIWKACRNLAQDKSSKVASAALNVLTTILGDVLMFKSVSDFDNLKNLLVKCMNTPYKNTRQAASRCLSQALRQLSDLSLSKKEAMLSATHSISKPGLRRSNTLPLKGKSKSKKKNPDGDDDDDNDSISSAASSSKEKSPSQVQFYSLPFDECLNVLSTIYTHTSSSAKIRLGVIEAYCFFLMKMPLDTIEKRYVSIATHLYTQIVASSHINSDSYRSTSARKHVYFILNDILAAQFLGEYGKLASLKQVTNEVLSSFNPKKTSETRISNPHVLTCALKCVTGLIKSLMSAITPVYPVLTTALDNLIIHPSELVRIAACECYQQLLLAVPSHGISILTSLIDSIKKQIDDSSTQKDQLAALSGRGSLVSCIISSWSSNSQHSSFDLIGQAFTTAVSLIKANGNVELVSVHVQAGWLIITGILSLGHSFAKFHLPQLLMLWKGVLIRSDKTNSKEQNSLELSYILHVRHYALTSLFSFLLHNPKLVTLDVARRLSAMLQHTEEHLATIPSKKFPETDQSKLHTNISLEAYDTIVRRRVLQCYAQLIQYHPVGDIFPANAMTTALRMIGDPDRFFDDKLSTTIAAGTGTFDSIWESCDNYAFGVTSKIKGFDLTENGYIEVEDQEKHWMTEMSSFDQLEQELVCPILTALEFDASILATKATYDPVPASSGLVDLSIELFSRLFPLQTLKIQESILEQLWTFVTSASQNIQQGVAQRKSLRGNAVMINAAMTVRSTLSWGLMLRNSKKREAMSQAEIFRSPRIFKSFVNVIRENISSQDPYARNIAAQSMGMLCSFGSSATTSEHIKYFIDRIVADTDPNTRGGCALALGYIMKYAGGAYAGLHLKTVLGILVSLASDPHPIVHFWALEAMTLTIGSAGLGFAPYSLSVLSTLSKLYLHDSHSDEVANSVSSNLNTVWHTVEAICQCVGALVNVLGPDLQENLKCQRFVTVFVRQMSFLDDLDYRVTLSKLRILQELSIFCPEKVNFMNFEIELHKHLVHDYHTPLRDVSIECLKQLIRTRSTAILKYLPESFAKDIWLAYDTTRDHANKEVGEFLDSWLEQSYQEIPLIWVTRIQEVLMKPRSFFLNASDISAGLEKIEENELDGGDEGASFAGGTNGNSDREEGIEPLRWQTRVKAVELLLRLIHFHFHDKSLKEKIECTLTAKVGDIVKIAFSASTSPVLDLRLVGMRLLNQVINEFKDIPDPDFGEVALLEQYQAQISSALTPAFSSDSSVDLALEAIKASASFIGSRIIRSPERMGRVLKLLIIALDSCQGTQLSLGELQLENYNSQLMLRVAILSLWAELQVASIDEKNEYLVSIVEPRVSLLIPLWINSLKDFARAKFEPEQQRNSVAGKSLSQMYSALSQKSILPIYEQSWLQLVEAVASLIEKDHENVFVILNGQESSDNITSDIPDIEYSSEPAAFFFVLFGLCFEAVMRSTDSDASTDYRLRVLSALNRILDPSVCGDSIYKEVIFSETADVLDRIALTGNAKELSAVVSIAHKLCMNHPSKNQEEIIKNEDGSEEIVDSVGQLFELFRIVILALTTMIPSISDSALGMSNRHKFEDPTIQKLSKQCLDCLVDMIAVFPSVIKTDLYACLLYVFAQILEDESNRKNLTTLCIPSQRKLFKTMMQTRRDSESATKVIDEEINIAVSHNISVLKSSETSADPNSTKENCLLWVTVVFGTCSEALNPNAPYVGDLCQMLLECIRIPEISSTAAGCIQTILVVTIDTEVGKALAERLFPDMILLAASTMIGLSETEEEETEETSAAGSDLETSISKNVIEILVGFTKALHDQERILAAMGLVMPVLLVYTEKNADNKPYVNNKVLELAGAHGDEFKELVQYGLSSEQKDVLQSILQTSSKSDVDDKSPETSSKTHIELKSFGQ